MGLADLPSWAAAGAQLYKRAVRARRVPVLQGNQFGEQRGGAPRQGGRFLGSLQSRTACKGRTL